MARIGPFPDDWEQRHEEMARLLEQEHQKFASKGGDLMDDIDDDDDDDLEDEDELGAHAVRGAHQPPPEGSFFGFNTSLEHLRGSNLDDLEEEVRPHHRLRRRPSSPHP